MKEIILGRCAEYLLINAHSSLVVEPLDCNKIWDAFQNAFAFRDPCKPGSYKLFVNITGGPKLKDKVSFSVVTEIVSQLQQFRIQHSHSARKTCFSLV